MDQHSQLLLEKVESLEKKLLKLVKEHRVLKEELHDALEENKELQHVIQMQDEEIKNFQNKYKISKIVTSIATDTQDAEQIKLRIDEYIREIDKCIAHLSE